ncbi:hypothetical protein EMPS_10064 [Entomortierella parvispora]|uniref:Uncharacterized protein n=1 Tax=Entomortierella parvispora TaxID=205924 RepID=A0A9P3HJG9_9FUNG|nr:hypothetical protein EMPS_10064 [Entomortierella parvispora]
MSTATTVSVATTATTAASQSTCTATISLEATDAMNSNGCPTTEQCYGQWLAWMHGHPVALMLLQYTTAASHAATHYIFSAIWTLTQSLVILLTVQSLEWIQSLGPMLLSWDIFLPGALFLTMNINPELLDGETHPEALIPLPIHRGSGSGSSRSSRSSSTTSNKKVTFHEQVMVLGRSAAMAQQQQQRHDLSLDSNGGNHYRSKIDASLPLVESPTRSEFSFSMDDRLSLDHKRTVLAMMRQEEAAYHCSVNDNLSDCGSSRSNSCRSSICSVDSNDSREVRKASSSSRLAKLFHPRRQQQQLTPPPSRPCSPVAAQVDLVFDAMVSANTAAAGSASMTTMAMHTSVPPPPHHKHPLVHRIMHPHQHKREVQQMHQSEAQSRSSLESDSWSISSHEYQPEICSQPRKTSKGIKTGKTLGERLGLKKKKTVQI